MWTTLTELSDEPDQQPKVKGKRKEHQGNCKREDRKREDCKREDRKREDRKTEDRKREDRKREDPQERGPARERIRKREDCRRERRELSPLSRMLVEAHRQIIRMRTALTKLSDELDQQPKTKGKRKEHQENCKREDRKREDHKREHC